MWRKVLIIARKLKIIGILLANLLITTIKELAISVADIFADPIIGTPLIRSTVNSDFLLACSCMLKVIFLIILLL